MAIGDGQAGDVDGEAEPLLLMTDVVKDFPGVRALDGIDLDVGGR